MKTRKNTDRGVAGLTILLSLVVFLFVIGLLVMIFALMGGNMQDAMYDSTTVSVTNESVTFNALNTAVDLSVVDVRSVVCITTPTFVANETTTGGTLLVGNVTLTSDCTLLNATALADMIGNGTVFVSYTYTWDADNTATDVMNDTTSSIASVTDWFPIFIVIGAMVVLILLTVIIISSIRGSGMISGGQSA